MTQQTEQDLLEQLEEQIGFLKASAEDYDSGREAEFKRLAHVIRVLAHDTSSSHALLAQLGLLPRGRNGLWFHDTAHLPHPGNLMPDTPLSGMRVKRDGEKISALMVPRIAMHGAEEDSRTLPFEEWWNAVILAGRGNDEHFSRRRLILAVANKDGGSHVDPELPEEYARVTRAASLGYKVTENGLAVSLDVSTGAIQAGDADLNAVPPAVRQIAHEMLLTLRNPYPYLVGKIPLPPLLDEAGESRSRLLHR